MCVCVCDVCVFGVLYFTLTLVLSSAVQRFASPCLDLGLDLSRSRGLADPSNLLGEVLRENPLDGEVFVLQPVGFLHAHQPAVVLWRETTAEPDEDNGMSPHTNTHTHKNTFLLLTQIPPQMLYITSKDNHRRRKKCVEL